MKNIVLLIITITVLLFGANNIFASDKIDVGVPIDFSSVFNSDDENWISCNPKWTWSGVEYICSVPKWTTWFQIVMTWIIKYILFIASLVWVLFIIINWILYSMAWMNDSFKTEAKDRIIKTLIWIIILIMSWVILNIIAPWVYA